MKKILFASTIVFHINLLLCSAVSAQNDAGVFLQFVPPDIADDLQNIRSQYNIAVEQASGSEKQIWSVPKDKQMEVVERLKTLEHIEGMTIETTPGDYRDILTNTSSTFDLTSDQQNILASIRGSATTSNLSIFRIAPMGLVTEGLTVGFDSRDGLLKSGTIRINLTESQSVSVVRDDVRLTPNGYVWRGTLEGAEGDALLLSTGDSISGTIHANGRLYKIQPLGSGLHAVIEKDMRRIQEEEPPAFLERMKDGGESKDTLPPNPVEADEQITVDVVVAYTKAVSEKHSDVRRDLIDVAVEETNQSFRNGHIGNVQINVVDAYETDYVESTNWDDHLSKFAENGDGSMDEIHEHRMLHKGDIAVLLVGDNKYCGEAREISATSDTAFVVVYYDCATGYYSFGHEIGHLFGARHDRFVDPTDTPFKYGHGYLNGTKWRTIMGYGDGCGGCTRRQFWSNPFVQIDGESAGTEDLEYDAKVILGEAKRVAGFK